MFITITLLGYILAHLLRDFIWKLFELYIILTRTEQTILNPAESLKVTLIYVKHV